MGRESGPAPRGDSRYPAFLTRKTSWRASPLMSKTLVYSRLLAIRPLVTLTTLPTPLALSTCHSLIACTTPLALRPLTTLPARRTAARTSYTT